jgi:predicted signal transduction protein with EAL and GGDEF domain
MVDTHSAADEESTEWARRIAQYSELGELAALVNAPGNDVFDSHDVPAERARMRSALAAFDLALAQCRSDLAASVDPVVAAPIAGRLDETALAMQRMLAEAELIFSYFSVGRAEQAGERMATMDRKYFTLNSTLAALRTELLGIQSRELEQQQQQAAGMRKWEWAIAGLVAIMVCGAAFYGHRISKQMLRSMQDSERANEAIRQLALYDPLTNLPNRRYFQQRLDVAIDLAQRGGWSMALLFLDLDGFKEVNDSFGHAAGDELLREVASRLRGAIRANDLVARNGQEADGEVQQLSRLGGDEFTVLLGRLAGIEEVAQTAERVLATLARPASIAGQDVQIAASIGIALFPADGREASELLRAADMAMYDAKSAGRGCYRLHSQALSRAAAEKMRVRQGLALALERSEFALHFQPLRDAHTGRLSSLEALLRWHDGEGFVDTGTFIPIAEESGLIHPIGNWVLRETCRQIAAWRDQGLVVPRVAVNVSARQLADPGFLALVDRALADYRVSAAQLEFEITESAMIRDDASTRAVLEALSDRGATLTLDDFGTGYSSLAYLQRYPIHRVKIDRSFVRDIPGDRDDVALISAILAMARSLGLAVVAEGVETLEQAELLRSVGCDELQGYLLARPASAEVARGWLEREKDALG